MKASEYFQGAIGGIFDVIFGIGGDGRRWSSAEHYDAEESPTPDIHIHGNIHQAGQDASIQSNAAPTSLDQSVIANARALQEGYVAANENSPVYEMRAPEYPPRPQEAAFNQAMQEEDNGIRM